VDTQIDSQQHDGLEQANLGPFGVLNPRQGRRDGSCDVSAAARLSRCAPSLGLRSIVPRPRERSVSKMCAGPLVVPSLSAGNEYARLGRNMDCPAFFLRRTMTCHSIPDVASFPSRPPCRSERQVPRFRILGPRIWSSAGRPLPLVTFVCRLSDFHDHFVRQKRRRPRGRGNDRFHLFRSEKSADAGAWEFWPYKERVMTLLNAAATGPGSNG